MHKVVAYIKRRPEKGQPHRQFTRLIEISSKQNRARNKPAFKGTDKRASNVKRGSSGHKCLRPGDRAPRNHHNGQHNAESVALDDELYGEFGG
jgi:hypothetical protein